jgi:polysaccharide transporter, PST family
MLANIRSKLQSNYRNLIGLFLTQGANAAFPLVVLPFAYSTIGSKPFSSIVVSESFILIILCVVLFSHDIEGVKWLSQLNHDDHKKKSRIFSLIFWSRISLAIIATPILLVFIQAYDSSLIKTTVAWTPILFGHIFYSAWFFQATENNLQIGAISAAIKLAAAALLIVLIKLDRNHILIPLIISLSYLAAGLVAFKLAQSKHGIRICKISLREIWFQIKGGRHIFLGNISILLFRGTNTLILNHFSSDAVVSVYALAEKIIKSLQASLRPISQLLHTKLMKQLSTNASANSFKLSMKYTKYQASILVLALLIGVTGYWLSIRNGLLSPAESQLVTTTLLMWPAMIFGAANFIVGNAALNAINQDRAYSRAVLTSGSISIATSIVLIQTLDLNGAIFAYVLGEGLLFAFILYIHLQKKI